MARTFSPKQLAAQRKFAARFGKKAAVAATKAAASGVETTARAQRRLLKIAQTPARIVARFVPGASLPLAVGTRLQQLQLALAQLPLRTAARAARKLVPKLVRKG